jgi:hypothetical protein
VFDSLPTPAQIAYDAIGRIANLPSPPVFTVQLRVTRTGQVKALTVSGTGKVTVE